MIWAANRDPIPRLRPPNTLTADTNSSISETPVTISGFTMGKLVIFIMMRLGNRFMPLIPMAATVPRTVDTAAETTAISSVLRRASMISRSSNSFRYQRRENPPHTTRLPVSVSLKENTISTKIGAYKKRNMRKA